MYELKAQIQWLQCNVFLCIYGMKSAQFECVYVCIIMRGK